MILTGPEIIRQVNLGNIRISPFDKAQVGPNSYDVRLADELFVYDVDWKDPLDMKKQSKLIPVEKNENGGWRLEPDCLYIGSTVEETYTDQFAPMMEGRSSVGRLGVWTHIAAGFGDVGFNGRWTLEIACVEPVIIYPGVRIAQICFHSVAGEIQTYGGKYSEKPGAAGSEIWREF